MPKEPGEAISADSTTKSIGPADEWCPFILVPQVNTVEAEMHA